MKEQLSFLNWKNQRKLCGSGGKGRRRQECQFGGSLLEGRRKSTRPLSTKHPVHLVLKSSHRKGAANDSRALIQPGLARMARRVLVVQAKKSKIKILDYVNTGNQLHLLIRLQDRDGFRRFSRAATGLIARKALHTERGPALKEKKPTQKKFAFWDHRPFTRIVTWKPEIKAFLGYLEKHHQRAEDMMRELYRTSDLFFSSA